MRNEDTILTEAGIDYSQVDLKVGRKTQFALVEYDGSDPWAAADGEALGEAFAWGSFLGLENLGFEFDVDALR